MAKNSFNDTGYFQPLKRNLLTLPNNVQLSIISALEGVCWSAQLLRLSLIARVGNEGTGVYVNHVATNRPHWSLFHNLPVYLCYLLAIICFSVKTWNDYRHM